MKYTAKYIAQVVTGLLVEQCRNNTVIMAEQCVQRTMLLTLALMKQQRLFPVVETGENY